MITFGFFKISLEIILQQNLRELGVTVYISETKQTVYKSTMFLYLQLASRS